MAISERILRSTKKFIKNTLLPSSAEMAMKKKIAISHHSAGKVSVSFKISKCARSYHT
jgi:hypothetical protein